MRFLRPVVKTQLLPRCHAWKSRITDFTSECICLGGNRHQCASVCQFTPSPTGNMNAGVCPSHSDGTWFLRRFPVPGFVHALSNLDVPSVPRH